MSAFGPVLKTRRGVCAVRDCHKRSPDFPTYHGQSELSRDAEYDSGVMCFPHGKEHRRQVLVRCRVGLSFFSPFVHCFLKIPLSYIF